MNIDATVIIFSTNILLVIEILFHLTTPLTTINSGVLMNSINFTTKINSTNHFLKNRAQPLKDDYNEVEERVITSIGILSVSRVVYSHANKALVLGRNFLHIITIYVYEYMNESKNVQKLINIFLIKICG